MVELVVIVAIVCVTALIMQKQSAASRPVVATHIKTFNAISDELDAINATLKKHEADNAKLETKLMELKGTMTQLQLKEGFRR